MKTFPQFTKAQLQLILVGLFAAQDKLATNQDLAKTIVQFDYYFEFFNFKNQLEKFELVADPSEYSCTLFTDLIDKLHDHMEATPA